MNYRHTFHAGSFADCMKHALLVWLIDALQRKPAPIFVLDTHAGAGRYDLLPAPPSAPANGARASTACWTRRLRRSAAILASSARWACIPAPLR